VLGNESLAHTLVLIEIGAAWQTAWEQEHIYILEALDVLKFEVCLNGDSVGGLYPFAARDAHGLDIHTTSTEDVNWSQAFDFLEAIGKKFIYFCHNLFVFCRIIRLIFVFLHS